ncbi:MAG: STAS domain-containing protein [Proteobacteria bacterium]|jgi:anti-anti-sigma factor|nr:STAS domain-containing protein [Pseudomonadota bacterium]MDA0929133.1 STAS domain-containing protein [Pseudomonadota bacterium]
MEIQSALSQDGSTLTLALFGKFDYTCQQMFQSAYQEISPKPDKFILDALELQSMDSSALGMLLLLRNHAGGDEADVSIVNAKPDIIKLLETCKFNELFNVSALG